MCVCKQILLNTLRIYITPLSQAGSDTRSIFKWGTYSLNSITLTVVTRRKKQVYPTIYPRKDSCFSQEYLCAKWNTSFIQDLITVRRVHFIMMLTTTPPLSPDLRQNVSFNIFSFTRVFAQDYECLIHTWIDIDQIFPLERFVGLVSLFNSMSTFMGYLMSKKRNSSDKSSPIARGIRGFIIFLKVLIRNWICLLRGYSPAF